MPLRPQAARIHRRPDEALLATESHPAVNSDQLAARFWPREKVSLTSPTGRVPSHRASLNKGVTALKNAASIARVHKKKRPIPKPRAAGVARPKTPAPMRRRTSLLLFLAIFGVYVLTLSDSYGGLISDGRMMFDV